MMYKLRLYRHYIYKVASGLKGWAVGTYTNRRDKVMISTLSPPEIGFIKFFLVVLPHSRDV